MKIFKELKERAESYNIKQDLNYLVAYGKHGEISEVSSCDSYCEDCIDEVLEEMQTVLKEKGSKLFYDEIGVDNDFFEIEKIGYKTECSPERDDFFRCDRCFKLIEVSVLHTFYQELEHYLESDLKLEKLRDEDCYEIYELLENAGERHGELIKRLRDKFITDNE